MKVGFLGWGKTGREAVVPFLQYPDVELTWVLRNSEQNAGDFASRLLFQDKDQGRIFGMSSWADGRFLDEHPVDVVVDFSNSDGIERYRAFAARGVRIVSALSHRDEFAMEQIHFAAQHVAVLSSPNITWGVNFLIAVSGFLRAITDEPDIQIVEEHFAKKKGISGTALQIAHALNVDPQKDVYSIRAGGILGRHEVIFGFPNQTVRLTHETIHRAAFGRGALTSARWLMKQSPGLYEMSDLIHEKLLAYLEKQDLSSGPPNET